MHGMRMITIRLTLMLLADRYMPWPSTISGCGQATNIGQGTVEKGRLHPGLKHNRWQLAEIQVYHVHLYPPYVILRQTFLSLSAAYPELSPGGKPSN